jgi:acyl-CoA reductase-like NAD-dependent aldehyde dehydrogenase
VAAARTAFPKMAATPLHQRAAILLRVSESLAARRAEVATLIAREVGKPLKYAGLEADRAVDTFRLAAEEACRIHGETLPLDSVKSGEGLFGFWHRKPLGVVAAITPFNFPLNLVAHKIAPAIAAGNAVVLKPAEMTPLTGAWLAALLEEAGLPAGALNLVQGAGPVGELLVRNPGVDKITFTGSLEVGLRILSVAGLKKVTLELGNNSPVVVAADADLRTAAAKAAIGANYNSGQVCISTQRVYVEAAVYDPFKKLLLEEVGKLKAGDPMDSETDLGPLITEREAERVEEWVNEAVAQGASLLVGGRRQGKMFTPTVLENVDRGMKVMCQEVFGPVMSLVRCETFEEALRQADDTCYGLQAAVFTRNLENALQAIKGLNFGGVVINDAPHLRPDLIPYGGNRQSGQGREGLRFAIEEMTSIQTVMVRTAHVR